MRIVLILTGFFFVVPVVAYASASCGYQSNAGDCMFNQGGWTQVALQHYDESSDYVTIWQKQNDFLICSERANHSDRRCAPYGGDVQRFRADAERETAARKAQGKKDKADQILLANTYLERTKNLGEGLKRDGWREIARCFDGHTWSYILQKNGARKYCQGINALSGPEEDICRDFNGDIAMLKQLSAKADEQVAAYDKAKQEGRLDAYLLTKIKSKKDQVSCWLPPEQINSAGVVR